MAGKNHNHPEYQYLELGKEILKNGIKQVDRGTGVVTYSVFGVRHEYDLSKGFPLLTTKRVYWRGVIEELYWFFSGQTNIKYLVDKNVHIWDDYPYKIYVEKVKGQKSRRAEPSGRRQNQILTKEEFIQNIAKNKKFAKKW